MGYIAISNKTALDDEYMVRDANDDWLMNAPLKTVRDVYGLENPALNRIIAAKSDLVELFLSRKGITITVERTW